MCLRAPSQRHRPVEWNRVMVTRDVLWRRKCRQVPSSGSMARRVLVLSSPMMAETMCSFTSAPLNERDFPAWQKVKGFLTKSKSTPGVVKAAQRTCGSDNACWRSISELPMLNRLRLFKEDGAKVACEIEENAMRQRN